MKIKLVFPNEELKADALFYRQEHFDFGEQIINGSALFDKIEFMKSGFHALEIILIGKLYNRLGLCLLHFLEFMKMMVKHIRHYLRQFQKNN